MIQPEDPLAVVAQMRPIVVASFPRSGTHLTIDFLRRNFAACKIRKRPWGYLDNLYSNLDRLSPAIAWGQTPQEAVEIMGRCARPIVKTHAFPDFRRFMPGYMEMGEVGEEFGRAMCTRAKVIYVMRDVRDVACSQHLWARGDLSGGPEDLRAFVRESGDRGLTLPQQWQEHAAAWRAETGTFMLQFEQIVREPEETVRRLAEFIGEEPLAIENRIPPRLQSAWHRRWVRLSQSDPFSTAIIGGRHEKRPRPFKWREVFNEADRRYIHEEAGEMLKELGYVESDAWVGQEMAEVHP